MDRLRCGPIKDSAAAMRSSREIAGLRDGGASWEGRAIEVMGLQPGVGLNHSPSSNIQVYTRLCMHAYSATHEPGTSSYVQVPAAGTPGAPAGVAAAVRFLGDPAQPVVDTRTAGGAAGPAHPGQP
ncbi:hypothetical protein XFF6990_340080 [Xanthomonas citri pv. fuscans]|nr:hypothetical protein XFF6990_340080 [Xanthomonas citri pv. fuscans]